jgi:DNA-binding CsgD family transcriptional regulator
VSSPPSWRVIDSRFRGRRDSDCGPGRAPADHRTRGTVRHLHVIGSDHPAVAPGAAPLIERAVEVDVLEDAVARVAGGDGGVVVVEAGAGLGKTALLEHTARTAADAGCRVLHAAPGPLERHFPFGVVRALLEMAVRDAADGDRAALLDGAAATAGALLLDGTVPGGDAMPMVSHSVLWLCSALADERPLVLVVDDAHWADRCSLQILAYVARRIADRPVLIVTAARADDPDAASDLLSLLGEGRAATVLHPQPLSPSGTVELIHRVAPDTPIDVCVKCHRAGGGNPWLLGELGRQIAVHGPDVVEAEEDDAPPVTAIARNVVRRRLAALSPRDRAVCEVLAVIEDDASPHVVAAVAGVPIAEIGPARDALVAAGLLAADRNGFAHNLIAVAVAGDLPRTAYERLHRETARAQMTMGVSADVIASHLLRCGPSEDPEASALLRRAAGDAARRGAPHTAAAYLERALAERAPGDDRGAMLARLAAVAFDAGLPDSRVRLREALDEATDRRSRIDMLTRLAALNTVDHADPELSQLLARELADETDPLARLAVEIATLDALSALAGRDEERARRIAAIDLDAIDDPALRKTVLAHTGWLGVETGTSDAATCAALALEALEGDVLLRDAGRRAAYHLAVLTLIFTDRHDEAHTAIERLRETPAVRRSLRLRATVCWYAAELAWRTGRLAEAENEARMVFDLVEEDSNVVSGRATKILVMALAERGAFDEAHELLEVLGLAGSLGTSFREVSVRHARAHLALAEGDYDSALAEALEVGDLREGQGRPGPSLTNWRSLAARALSHLGRRDEAVVLADEELALARSFGSPVAIAGAMHARAVAEADDAARVELCEQALPVASSTHAVLEAVRLRLELGSTLAYMGSRVEAREALRPALAEADAAGAVLLAERARRELVATGLRPRQAATEGPAALTPRQRQICELAAAGKSNREIAQELFLSAKTVETHLLSSYRKLGVNGRTELGAALAGA